MKILEIEKLNWNKAEKGHLPKYGERVILGIKLLHASPHLDFGMLCSFSEDTDGFKQHWHFENDYLKTHSEKIEVLQWAYLPKIEIEQL